MSFFGTPHPPQKKKNIYIYIYVLLYMYVVMWISLRKRVPGRQKHTQAPSDNGVDHFDGSFRRHPNPGKEKLSAWGCEVEGGEQQKTYQARKSIWLWLKVKQEGLRGFWSMFPLTKVPFWSRSFEPQPYIP